MKDSQKSRIIIIIIIIKRETNNWTCQRTKKKKQKKTTMEHEGGSDTNCNWCTRNGSQIFRKETGKVGNQRTRRDDPNYSIVKISQNTEESPGNLKRLVATVILVKDHLLTLVGKTRKE